MTGIKCRRIILEAGLFPKRLPAATLCRVGCEHGRQTGWQSLGKRGATAGKRPCDGFGKQRAIKGEFCARKCRSK